jgi:hypothetical protein
MKLRGHIILGFFLLASFSANAQGELRLPERSKSYMDFVPAGWDTLGVTKGDLNKDGKEDVVLALKSKSESDDGDMDNDPDRYVVILFKEGSTYRKVLSLGNILMCRHCGGVFGDPYNYVLIEKGVLHIDHYGGSAWRWSETRKFRYQNGDFYLIGMTDHSYWNVKECEKYEDFAGTKYEDVNLVTGTRVRKEISEDCKLLIDKKDKIKVTPLKKMAEYKREN